MQMQDIQAHPHLSNAEWQAVAIALHDAEHAIEAAPRGDAEGRIARLFRWMTGIEPARPLADPQLDAVRRFVWASRRRVTKVREIGGELRAFGYSCEQIEALRLVAA